MNSLSNYKLFAIFVIRLCLLSHISVIILINVNESMTLQCIFCTKNKFLQSGILIQSSSLDLIIGFLLFSYSALTIRIVRIVFGNQKMNEYEYRILLFGPNYSNSRIVRIIRSNTGLNTIFNQLSSPHSSRSDHHLQLTMSSLAFYKLGPQKVVISRQLKAVISEAEGGGFQRLALLELLSEQFMLSLK